MNQNQTDSISLGENGCLGKLYKQIKASPNINVLNKNWKSVFRASAAAGFQRGGVGVRVAPRVPSVPGTELKELGFNPTVSCVTGGDFPTLHMRK